MVDSHSGDWNLSEEEWCQRLSAMRHQVLRQAGTERAFAGEYTDTKTQGAYCCRAYGYELFRPNEKFDSHCDWPSFFSPLAEDRVIEHRDTGFGTVRTEVLCSCCKSHLGHVFEGESHNAPTDLRYCINSISLILEPDETAE